MQCEEATGEQNMDITKWGDIGNNSWQNDGSVENAKKMHKCTRQCMEFLEERVSKWGEKEWSMVLKDEFVKEAGLRIHQL